MKHHDDEYTEDLDVTADEAEDVKGGSLNFPRGHKVPPGGSLKIDGVGGNALNWGS